MERAFFALRALFSVIRDRNGPRTRPFKRGLNMVDET